VTDYIVATNGSLSVQMLQFLPLMPRVKLTKRVAPTHTFTSCSCYQQRYSSLAVNVEALYLSVASQCVRNSRYIWSVTSTLVVKSVIAFSGCYGGSVTASLLKLSLPPKVLLTERCLWVSDASAWLALVSMVTVCML
jgi:hypothetical protein